MTRGEWTFLRVTVACAVTLAAIPHVGYWWAILYGTFFEAWLAYRLTTWLLTP